MAALARVAPNLRTTLAAHVTLQFVDGRGHRSTDHIKRHGLMGIAPVAADFQISEAGVEGIAHRWGRLGWPLVTQHAVISGLACQRIGVPSGDLGPFRGCPDRAAVQRLA
ncbi:MAG: hypothetical protein JWQ24_3177 [Tardiphaga sp.]|nr:hypothetical protein [Tardiphaga sp.]